MRMVLTIAGLLLFLASLGQNRIFPGGLPPDARRPLVLVSNAGFVESRELDSSGHQSERPLSRRTFSETIPQERDYISSPVIEPPVPAQAAADGDIVSYQAFDGTVYSLRQFNGRYTALLLKQQDLDLFTIARVRDLLDRTDILYAHFTEFLPLEPSGTGLARIAFVTTCGGGCGFIGIKGIEIDPQFLNPNGWQSEGVYGGSGPYVYILHEMTHNFDRYSNYIMYGSDVGHAWTDFMNFYIGVYDSFGSASLNPDELLQSRIDAYFLPYLAYPGSTWEACIRDNLCNPSASMQQHTQGGLVLRVAQLHGPVAMRQAFTYLQNAITTRGLNASFMTTLQKNDLLIESLSYGAAANLACYFDAWHWPVSSALRAQLASAFSGNPICQDIDNDGYSPLTGDCDDSDPALHPGAVETLNGIDDDCDGIIDDLLFTESGDFSDSPASALLLPVPDRVLGTISSTTDSDNFKINLAGESIVRFTLKSVGGFKGWFFLLNQGSDSWRTFMYVGEGASESLQLTLGPGQWNFYVAYNAASNPGPYELITRVPPPWPRPFSTSTAASDQPNHYVLVAPPIPSYLSIYSNVVARFWVSGIGWVGSVPASAAMQTPFGWSAPTGLDVQALSYRVQFVAGGIPVSDVSSPSGFLASQSLGAVCQNKMDFDVDGKTDFGFYRAGLWGFLKSSASFSTGSSQFFSWGGSSLQPIVADFDGDSKADLAYMVPPSGGQSAAYAILRSTTGYGFGPGQPLFVAAGFPSLGDTPVVGDVDADGKADPGIWRASQGVWIIPKSGSNYTTFVFSQWGQLGDIPIVCDIDGDGKADLGFYRDGLWGFLKSSQSYSTGSAQFFSWGGAGLQPIVGDFDGDGKADIGYMVPPSGGQSASYAILKSSTGYSFAPGQPLFVAAGFPSLGDTPVVGDFDGDGKADPGIWRESQGVWIIPLSSANYASYVFSQWGQSGDIPVPNTTGKH